VSAAPPRPRVRPAEPRDVPVLHALVRELAVYEREPDAVEATPADLERALFGADPRAHCHVAQLGHGDGGPRDDGPGDGGPGDGGPGDGGPRDGAPSDDGPGDDGPVVGFALWFVSFSTWRGRHGIWLEDLFVRPSHRGLGVGRALLAELATECVRRGYARLEWSVLDWNEPAQAFYRRIGAVPQDEWTTFRLDGDTLAALGAGPPSRD
jgi:ribosomal protein S18 acetylase RimI-like enzyme